LQQQHFSGVSQLFQAIFIDYINFAQMMKTLTVQGVKYERIKVFESQGIEKNPNRTVFL